MSIKLYFFPYAGASDINFKKWETNFKEEIDVHYYNYPGRKKRQSEDYYLSIQDACEDIYLFLKRDIEGNSYYLSGHCLGAIIVFELCYLIKKREELNMPEGIFLSGQSPPGLLIKEGFHHMEDQALLEYLYKNNMIKEGLMDNDIYEYVKELILKPIKADSYIYDNYEYTCKQGKLDVKCHILFGEYDKKYTADQMLKWSGFFTQAIDYSSYPAGHMFIEQFRDEYITDIRNTIMLDSK